MEDSKILTFHIDETEVPAGLDILTRFRSFLDLRVGRNTIFAKVKKNYPQAKMYYSHSDPKFQEYFLAKNPNLLPYNGEEASLKIRADQFQPWDLLQAIPSSIEEDLLLSKTILKWRVKFKPKQHRFNLVGKDKNLYIHPTAVVYPGVVIDTTSGPVIIDKDVRITSFSFLEGPLYIGSNSSIDSARITGGTIIGKNCRVGGEIENSILQDYSNKHHEGFLGHSTIGSWVNLGALSTTSDLKNNYGIVPIRVGKVLYSTGSIKFGSIIGDLSKIGIGVMLNTGTTIDVGCSLVDSRISGYVPPFTWLSPDVRYKKDRFIQDTKKIMARRSVELDTADEENLSYTYNKLLELEGLWVS